MKSLKHSFWVYAGLTAMLLAFLSFSLVPLASTILKADPPPATASVAENPQQERANLEAEVKGYQAILQREPDNENALRGLLQVRLAQGNLQGTIEPLERLAELNPQGDYTLLLAQAKQRLGDREGAEQAYRQLLAERPREILPLKGLTDLLLLQGRGREAVSLVQKTLTQAVQGAEPGDYPELTSLQLLLGEIYLVQQRYPEAIAAYDLAMEQAPDDFRPALAKALLLRRQGQVKEAEPLWRRAFSLAPPQYKAQLESLEAEIPAPPPTPRREDLP